MEKKEEVERGKEGEEEEEGKERRRGSRREEEERGKERTKEGEDGSRVDSVIELDLGRFSSDDN